MSDSISYLRNWFLEKHIKIRNDWLTQCVDHFKSQARNISLNDLRDQTYHQWLLNDIADSSIRCFPEINATTKILSGNFTLQIQTLIDISIPAYSQLEQIYNLPQEKLEEEFEQEKSSRVLKLVLTDGTKTINAIEYRPIKSLSLNIDPGCKITLKGPIKVSFNGILYLEEHNVHILGGEVDTLLEENSVKNTLLKSLNLLNNSNLFNRLSISTSANENPIPRSCNNLRSNTNNENTNNSAALNLRELDHETRNNTNILIDDMEDAFLAEFDFETENVAPKPTAQEQEVKFTNKEEQSPKHVLDPSYPIRHNNKPVIFVRQVNEIQSMIIKAKDFVLIIKIEEFVKKICMENGEWTNLVKISDYLVNPNSTVERTTNVKLDSDLISKYAGYNAQKMESIKNQLKENPHLINDFFKNLMNMRNYVLSKHFIADIKIFPQLLDQPPIIFNLEELLSKHDELIHSKKNYDS